MFPGKTDHVVFYCPDIKAVRAFYEGILEITPNTVKDNYVTYSLGEFTLCFKQISDQQDCVHAVVHIGVDFPTRSQVDYYFNKIKQSDYPHKPEKIIEQSPYRFYVKDPAGYTLEFESWS